MQVHYTGRNTYVSDSEKEKLQRKFDKVHRILGRKIGSEAHVVVTRQRHLYEAEVTLHAHSHTLVVTATSADGFASLQSCVDKLEKQAIKNKHRMIDVRRPERQRGEPGPALNVAITQDSLAAANSAATNKDGPRVIHSRSIEPKPLTLEGAMMTLEEENLDQVTYRDAESDGALRVLLRRRDGNLELVEAL